MRKNAKNTGPDWIDPDDAPELTDDFFDRAAIWHGDKLIRPANGTLTRPGRPKLANPKRQVTLRLDGDLIDKLRATGPGWQTRVNDMLRKAAGG